MSASQTWPSPVRRYQQEEYDASDPVLLVEILSPSNRAETWTNVWAYTTIPSVREILVLHSLRIRAELLRRDDTAIGRSALRSRKMAL